MEGHEKPERDWGKTREKALKVASNKPRFFISGYQKIAQGDDQELWESLGPLDYMFSAEQSKNGSTIQVGRKNFTVVDSFDSLDSTNKEGEKKVLLVEDDKRKLKIFKRLPPHKLLECYLNAKELEDNGIKVCPNPRLLRVDNEWEDTIEYDYIPGVTVDEYIADAGEEVRPERWKKVLNYFDTVYAPLSRGQLLRSGRVYNCTDFNAGSIIVSNPDSEHPDFFLIDLEGSIVDLQGVSREQIERSIEMNRGSLLHNINLRLETRVKSV